MQYYRFEPGYLTERGKAKSKNSFRFERCLRDISSMTDKDFHHFQKNVLIYWVF